MRQTIGFIGLGLIGLPAAINLVRAGHEVIGFSLDNMDKFTAAGGKAASSCAEVAGAADIVFHCLPDAKAMDNVVFGANGILTTLRKDALVIELSSYALADKTRLRDALTGAGAELLDCELTTRGGSAGMVERDCVIISSGKRETAERVQPLFDAISKRALYVGEFGMSLRLKTVNNLLVGVHVLAAAEAIALGEKAGFDPKIVAEVLAQGAGSSVMLERYGTDMAKRSYDEDMKGMIKTFNKYFGLIADLADEVDAATPLTAVTERYFKRAIEAGYVTSDLSALYEIVFADTRKPA